MEPMPLKRAYRSDGQVVRTYKRFWKKVIKQPDDGCWEWQGSLSTFGHGCVRIGTRLYKAHRVAWMWKRGPIPSGMCVCHKCDNPRCVRVKHLFLGTKLDNMRDMIAKGRQIAPQVARGEASSNAVLTDAKVLEIRKLYATGNYTQKQIGAMYGVTQVLVGKIARKEVWQHVECDTPVHAYWSQPKNVKRQKLTDDQIREMRKLRRQGWKYQPLQDKFGVGVSFVWQVTTGKIFTHVKEEP